MTTGEAIIKLREKMGGLTQQQLAQSLGVTITSVSRYENGREPSRQVLKKLADLAGFGEPSLRDIFEQKRREDIAARIENLPSGGSQRRVTLEDISQWAAIAEDIANSSTNAIVLTEQLAQAVKTGIKASQLESQLRIIQETIRMSLTYAADLGEDIEVYIAPPDRPGTVSYRRLEKIKAAKDQARKTPKED